MSGLMERLRQRDLVTSDRCPGNRRRQVWQLTAAGSHAVAQVERDLKERSAGLAQYVEIPPLRRLLRELAHRAGLPDANVTLRTFPPAEHAATGRLGGSP